jgi:hypothetical protein
VPAATRAPAPTAAPAALTAAPATVAPATAAPATAAPASTATATATQAPQVTATSAAVEGPPAIPHAIDDPVHKDCTVCHGQGKIKPFPANHTAFTVDVCTGCHKSAQPSGAGSAATPAPTAAAATPTTAAAASPTAAVASAGGAPAIPHDLAGRDNCLLCHNPDGGVKPAPKDHAGRTSEQCQACHKPKS